MRLHMGNNFSCLPPFLILFCSFLGTSDMKSKVVHDRGNYSQKTNEQIKSTGTC